MANKRKEPATLAVEVIPGALIEDETTDLKQGDNDDDDNLGLLPEEESTDDQHQEPTEEEKLKAEEKQRKYEEYKKKQKEEQLAKRGTLQTHKGGVRVVDQFGKLEKKRRTINIGLSDLILPPFTRKIIATYQIIGADKISTSTKLPVERKTVSIPGSYMLDDFGESDPTKRRKMMKHLRRPEIRRDKVSDKHYIDEDLLEEIVFYKSLKRVSVETDYMTFVFLELHPLNGSNKRRDKTVAPKFERIDLVQSRTMAFQQAETDLAFEAETEIVNMVAKDEIIAYATSADVPTMENGRARPVAAIKHDLRVWARKYPKSFFALGSNVKAAIKLNVLDFIGIGLIESDPQRRSFISPVTDGIVFTWPVGHDPVDSLVAHCVETEEGQELYEALKNQLDFYK